jgi:hypothetical protein
VIDQVFRAVGDEIAHYLAWKVGPFVKAGKKPQRWETTRIGDALDTWIFDTSTGGLQMGG